MNNKRKRAFDYLRIIATIMVIGVHAIGGLEKYVPVTGAVRLEYSTLSRLNALGVPIFFSMSGYFVLGKKINSLKIFYAQRFKRVVLPYLFYAGIYVVYFVGIEEKTPTRIPLEYLKRLLEGKVHPTHWFVYTIISLYFVSPFLQKMLMALSRNEKSVFIVGCMGFNVAVDLLNKLDVRVAIDSLYFNGAAILCFLIGGWISCSEIEQQMIPTKLFIAISVISLLIYEITGIGSLISWIVLGVIMVAHMLTKDSGVLLEKIGGQTYSVYLLHAAMISAFLKVIHFSTEMIWWQMIAFIVMVFVASLVVSTLFDACTWKLLQKGLRKND